MKWVRAVTSLVCILLVSSIISAEAQVFDIDTVVEDTSSLSLELLSSPSIHEKEQWLNWTIRMTVVEYNPEWNTSNSLDHPSLTVAVRADTVDFTEYNNVSFSLNLGSEGRTSMSIKFIHYLHVFTTYNLGNLSHITSQDYNMSVKFASDMPTTAYTVEMRLYNPFATTTTITSTTTSSTTTTTTTTGNSTPTVDPQFFIPIIVISLVTIFAIVAVLKSERLK